MRTVRDDGEHETVVKRSRFVCAVARVTDEEAAREFLRQRRKLHPSARHHCYAYVVGEDAPAQKSSDDGEPSGTAGVPMLETLHRNELTNTVAVVSRHFGGVLLGAGGLVRAYSGAVSATLDRVGLAERRPMRSVSTTVDYALAGKLENHLRAAQHRIAEVHYGEDVRFDLHVPDSGVGEFEEWLAETTAGAASVEHGDLTHVDVDVDL